MTIPPPPSSPLSGDRGLTCLDWPALTDTLADILTPTLDGGADHLLPATALRTHLTTALLTVGVQPHELHLDHRTPHGRAPIWLTLETGIHTTLDALHLDHHTTTRTHTKTLTHTITRTLAIPAHEHLVIALALPAQLTALAGMHWPVQVGQEAQLPADRAQIDVVCHTRATVADHTLIALAASPALQPYPLIVDTQPHLFPL